jgi:hypothetical protein
MTFAPLSLPVAAALDAPERPVQPPEAPAAVTHAPAPSLPPGARLSAALRTIRWTVGVLAVELGLSPSTTRNWTLGRQPIAPEILAWVEDLAACHVSRPPPPVPDGRVPILKPPAGTG